MTNTYRGTYVIERKEEDGSYEAVFSVSEEVTAKSIDGAYNPLLSLVGEKIEKYRHMMPLTEEEFDDAPVEVVPDAPTIRSVETHKEN